MKEKYDDVTKKSEDSNKRPCKIDNKRDILCN